MRPVGILLLAGLGAAACAPGAPAPEPPPSFPDVARFVASHCARCHAGPGAEAGLDLAAIRTEQEALAREEVWRAVRARVAADEMPPAEEVRPPARAVSRLLAWIDGAFATPLAAAGGVDPGRVTMRRLSRREWRNTVRDLLGSDLDGLVAELAATFPADDVAYGFDHVGDVLSVSPLWMERATAAAGRIAEAAIQLPDPPVPVERGLAAADLASTLEGPPGRDGSRNLYSAGEVRGEVLLPRAGEYLLRVRAYGQQAGPEPARLALRAGPREILRTDVPATAQAPGTYEARFRGGPGALPFAVAFLNDYYDPQNPDRSQRDRNLVVLSCAVVGPVDPPPAPPEAHRRILGADPGGGDVPRRAREVLAALAGRAYRRPATSEEVDRLLGLAFPAAAPGRLLEEGIRIALEALLASPHFLFRVEAHPSPEDPTALRSLDEFQVASRLSYFLWSSMPDDELFRAAAGGTLRADPARQARRMLRDARAGALTEGFADAWLTLTRLAGATPDPERFPTFDDALRQDMLRETEMLFEAVVWEDRSVLDLLDADFTFVNERLAHHYGIPGVTGDRFRRVAVTDERRRGLLGHASILTATSHPTRTSPVKRGKWVLETLLGSPPPPPPPGAGDLDATAPAAQATSIRERMARHRADPACTSCHERMDPIGFGLENFDAVGAWREEEGGTAVDASGVLPGGLAFEGPAGLRGVLREDPRFLQNLAGRLLAYALGRGLETYDAPAVARIVAIAGRRGYRFGAFVEAIVTSEPFLKARGEEPAK